MLFYNTNIDQSQYVIATYWIKSKNADLATCAWNLAIGQSVGNPNVRNQWETEELFEQSSCVIVHNKKDFWVIDYFLEKLPDYPLFLILMMDEFLNL